MLPVDDPYAPPGLDVNTLSVEARALLCLAKRRGTFEIRAKKDGFDSAERLLAVAVEVKPEQWRLLLDKSEPRQTIRFLGRLCIAVPKRLGAAPCAGRVLVLVAGF